MQELDMSESAEPIQSTMTHAPKIGSREDDRDTTPLFGVCQRDVPPSFKRGEGGSQQQQQHQHQPPSTFFKGRENE
jgi:hypothetical protein